MKKKLFVLIKRENEWINITQWQYKQKGHVKNMCTVLEGKQEMMHPENNRLNSFMTMQCFVVLLITMREALSKY